MSKNQPPSLDEIRDFVIAGHGNLDKIKQMLAVQPALLNLRYEWRPGDTETALQAAGQVGNKDLARYLLAQGAPMDICTAAMLGLKDDVEHFLMEDPASINATGAHGIPLLPHAALSGNVELIQLLYQRGARDGMSSSLINAVSMGHHEMTKWIVENGKPDVSLKNYQGKTAFEIATERGDSEIASMLKAYGANQ